MKYNNLGKTGLKISQVGFGVLTMGGSQLNLPLEEGADLIKYALKQGINFLDTAEYYETYPYIREALRDQEVNPVIVSKCLSPTYSHMEAAIEQARTQLNRDFIDVFLLHEVRSNGDFDYRLGAFQALEDAKAKGYVKAIGLSTHHVDVTFDLARDVVSKKHNLDVVFPLINYKGLGIRQGSQPGTKEDMEKAITKCKEAGLGVFAMKAFGGGNLTGTYKQALDYVYGIKEIDSVVVGFGQKKEIDDILSYLDGTMKIDYQPNVGTKRIYIDQGDCEGCGACINRCPNKAIFRNEFGLAEVDHVKCVTCGYCAPVCPVRAILLRDSR